MLNSTLKYKEMAKNGKENAKNSFFSNTSKTVWQIVTIFALKYSLWVGQILKCYICYLQASLKLQEVGIKGAIILLITISLKVKKG